MKKLKCIVARVLKALGVKKTFAAPPLPEHACCQGKNTPEKPVKIKKARAKKATKKTTPEKEQ